MGSGKNYIYIFQLKKVTVTLTILNLTCLKSYVQSCKHYYQQIAACVEKLLLIANSSFNFVIYCLAGKGFRQQMCKLIFRRIAFVCRQISTVASGEDPRAYGLVGDGGEQVIEMSFCFVLRLKTNCQE